MYSDTKPKKINNIILSFMMAAGVLLAAAAFFDFYYELNDDMVIKDILSGAYSGIPDGHTNQMLYPLGWLLSLVYSVLPPAPVLGIFLCLCFGFCFWIAGSRSLHYFKDIKLRLAVILLEGVVFFAFLLWELVYVQYSVVCGVLSGTACFWFYTIPKETETGEFWKEAVIPLLLVIIAFLIRPEMLLLTTPFLAAAGICHWGEEVQCQMDALHSWEEKRRIRQIFCKANVVRYVIFLVVLTVALGALWSVDYLACEGQEWKDYRQFFNARTTVYDYTWYPEYEGAQEFYENQGISELQYRLIENYNFGLDETITANTLDKAASYGERARHGGTFGARMKGLVSETIQHVLRPTDAPYNYFVLAAYVLVIGLAILQREKSYLWKAALLLVMRTISWSYLIWAGRVVTRVSHPLYFIEFLILLAILIRELYDRPLWNMEKYYRRGTAAVFILLAAVFLPISVSRVQTEQQRRAEVTVSQYALDAYAKAHPENYYYLDVYSSVNFMEKIFEDYDNGRKNYDLLGGWVCHSPLQKKNLKDYMSGATEVFGEELSIRNALLQENFYFGAAAGRDTSFMTDYYESVGVSIVLEETDRLGEGDAAFVIYKLTQAEEKQTAQKKR